MKTQKEILTEKYDFEFERLYENKAGIESITNRQKQYINSLLFFRSEHLKIGSEILELFNFYGLSNMVDDFSKSQAMFFINKVKKNSSPVIDFSLKKQKLDLSIKYKYPKKIKLYNGDILKCPICNTENIHQLESHIIQREDDSDGIDYRITENGVRQFKMTAEDIENQTGERRSIIHIFFECEHCGEIELNKIPLVIYQHKGNTFIEWRKIK